MMRWKLVCVALLLACAGVVALSTPQTVSSALEALAGGARRPKGWPPRAMAPGSLPTMGAEGALVSRYVEQPPQVDGEVDHLWTSAEPLRACMTRGRDSLVCAFDVELFSVHTAQEIYFMARWLDPEPGQHPGAIRNKLTLHFDLHEPWPGARDVTCLVACHTGFVNDQGQVAYMSAETIPPGRTDPLPAAGQWQKGIWLLEWSRPLVHANGFDVQFDDPDGHYPFFVKVFEWREGHPDPTSSDYVLVFQR